MGQLAHRVSTEVTDTRGPGVDVACQLSRRRPFHPGQPLTIVPVLTEEAVKATAVIKYGQVPVAVFRARGIGEFRVSYLGPSWTDPIGDAVCGKWVVVPIEVSLFPPNTNQLSFPAGAKSAVAPFACWNLTFVCADIAFNTSWSSWRLRRKAELLPRPSMDLLDMWRNFFRTTSDTPQTYT